MSKIDIDTLNAADCIERYIKIRDAKSAFKKKMDEQLKKYDKGMELIGERLEKLMIEVGTDQLKAGGGVAYPEIKDKISVSSSEEFRGFIIDSIKSGDDDAICFLNAAANKTAVMEYLQENSELPPGISKFSEKVIVVRKNKPTKKVS